MIVGRLEMKVVPGNRIGQFRQVPTVIPFAGVEQPIRPRKVRKDKGLKRTRATVTPV